MGFNEFERNLWNPLIQTSHYPVAKTVYTSCFLPNILTRPQHKKIIDAHFYTVVIYGSPVWAGSLSFKDTCRLNTLLFKTIGLYCRDFSHEPNNRELCSQSTLESFNLVRIIGDMTTLHNLCTNSTDT